MNVRLSLLTRKPLTKKKNTVAFYDVVVVLLRSLGTLYSLYNPTHGFTLLYGREPYVVYQHSIEKRRMKDICAIRKSNPGQTDGNRLCYHYTNSAQTKSQEIFLY